MLGTSQKRLFAALCSRSSSKACIILALLSAFFSAPAADRRAIRNPRPKPETPPPSVEALAERIKQSVVVISHFDRDGKEDGVGAGFVVSSNGLIATSLHVIREGRPIKVQFAEGQSYEVTEIHAWDRKLDLAVVRVAATNLPVLALGDSELLK